MAVDKQEKKRTITTACVLLGVLAVHARAQNIDTARLFKQDSPAVVLIISQKSGTPIGYGTGALISKDGTILSALHVVQGGDSAVVKLKSGDVYDKVSVIAFDARRDLVVLKISGFDLPLLPLGNSNDVKEGDPVAMISNPKGLEGSISQGIVSAVRDIGDLGFKVIQTTAAASPGSSGGAILNANGELVAMLSFKIVGGENLNFGIPVNYARGMLDTHESFPLSDLAGRIGVGSVKPLSQLAEATPTDVSGEWKSLLSGNTFKVRLEEGHAYVEQTLTDKQRAAGIFQLCDLNMENGQYRGVCRTQSPVGWKRWTKLSGVYEKEHKLCSFQGQMEITKQSPTRVEGRVENRTTPVEKWSFNDYKECGKRFKLEWKDFVWIRPN
ncbi:MAG: S1C family serine protease [Terriglobia bacterium]|jgi:S1-C subfamily serine protease